ncbi:MAG TPA: PEP-CTERM sorting domain-containing protein [Pyrinomonadaceae bacterium]|nr:PEP-CTERM sorting domain-containing protein [Pyrinomonadaceae bacterium]
MRNRAISPAATILSVLLLVFAASPAQAGPVAFSEVVHVMGNVQNGGQSQELRLRSVSQQEGSTPVNGSVVSSNKSSAAADTSSEPKSLISTATGGQEGQQQGNVEVVEEGDVTGTVCDCGEIFIPGGGFPAWLALGGVPLVCVLVDCTPDHHEDCVGPDCNPCVNCTTVPEPATVFLLGSGLAAIGAKVRRRYTKSKTDDEASIGTGV